MPRLFSLLVVGLLVFGLVFFFQNSKVAPDIRWGSAIQPRLSIRIGEGSSAACQQKPEVTLPQSALTAKELAVIVNDQDPQSVAVANYYQQQRQIPAQNLIHIDLPPESDTLDPKSFQAVKTQIDAALSPQIQALALSFSRPFRVGCMGITSALAMGYDPAFCQQTDQKPRCRMPQVLPTYNADSDQPFTDFKIRPAMILAGANLEAVKELIDRGVRADATLPKAAGYFVTTQDRARSVRQGQFAFLAKIWNSSSGWQLQHLQPGSEKLKADALTPTDRILFYLTGLPRVPRIGENQYLPGAIADHLTSAGGDLFGSSQMSILAWLKAGVTASYGTVVEPCNFLQKFPDAEILVANYYKGQTALEAYWKSVASPQEGIFVGEPLANPIHFQTQMQKGRLHLKLSSLEPGKTYQVYAANSPEGEFTPISEPITLPDYQVVELIFGCQWPYYKLVEGN